ncbi:hypothetical protein HGO21_08330 [Acinetobacter sp. CUI P1]|nr:hypothetical protein [Acinetobacter sp. CUI P1]
MVLIQKFITLSEQLKLNMTEVAWTENLDTVKIEYTGTVSNCINIFKDPIFANEFTSSPRIFLLEVDMALGFMFYEEFIESYDLNIIPDSTIASVKVTFQKKLCLNIPLNTVLFFRLESFIENFNYSTVSWDKFFKEVDCDYFVKWYLPVTNESSNVFLKVIPLLSYTTNIEPLNFQSSELIKKTREIQRENTRTSDNYWPISLFFNNLTTSDNKLNEYIATNFYFSSLVYIANKHEGINFMFRGQKNAILTWDATFQPIDLSYIKKLYEFAYKDTHTEDRFEIMQNVISLYLSSGQPIVDFNSQLQNMVETIERHFTLYVNDKINHYFGQTKALLEESQKYAVQAKDEADKIVSNINQTSIGIITALITGILSIINQSMKLLIVSIIIHIIFFSLTTIINSLYSITKKKSIEDGYEHYSSNYSNLSVNEKNDLKNAYVVPGLNLIRSYMQRYLWISGSIILLLVSISIIAIFSPDRLTSVLKDTVEDKMVEVVSLKEGMEGNIQWWELQNQGISIADKSFVDSVNKILQKNSSLQMYIDPGKKQLFSNKSQIKNTKLLSVISDDNKDKYYNILVDYRMDNREFRDLILIQVTEKGLVSNILLNNTIVLNHP